MRFITTLAITISLLIHTYSDAFADPNIQSVNQGQNPYRSFSGSIAAGSQLDLLTIPNDQVFVVTTCITNEAYMHIRQDSIIKLQRLSYACYRGNSTAFTQGKAHLVIDSGSVLNIQTSNNSTVYYYIEGYFSKP
ncbi:MAG: hypothetical protein CL916_09035 [Deltaproteobacteria bacterium]|nr:hypothetical protein [Deltaproteobacteria bacterium]